MSNAIETQGFKLEIGDGNSPIDFTEVKEIASFQAFDGAASEIDVTHLQSTAKEFRMGLQDFGSFSMELNFVAEDPGQILMRAAKASREVQDFKATLSDGTIYTFQGFVLSASLSGGVDSKMDTSMNIRITGDVTVA